MPSNHAIAQHVTALCLERICTQEWGFLKHVTNLCKLAHTHLLMTLLAYIPSGPVYIGPQYSLAPARPYLLLPGQSSLELF